MPTAPLSLMPALRRVIAGRAADRSDADLLGAFVADRDADAFAALVRRHGPMVLGVCRRVVRDPDTADDAFQAVFLVLARRAGEVRPRSKVGAWLYGVAYRTALKARAVRARRRTRESQVDAIPEPAAPPAADGWDDLKPVLDEELARLPERLRVPVVLCDLEGRPQRAVAGQLGIAPATLAGRLADARKTLAARLTRRGVALSAAALGALLAERGAAAAVHPQLAAGVVKAAEAVAAGGAAAGLVSANALQLCDGVMRMIFLTKLKTAAGVAVAVLALVGGVGPGLVPAAAQDDRPAAAERTARPAPKGQADDAAFLDRVCLEFRGSKGTPVEHGYFATDTDADKRKKVTRWLLDGPPAAQLGGKAEVAWVDEVHTVTGPGSGLRGIVHSRAGKLGDDVKDALDWVDWVGVVGDKLKLDKATAPRPADVRKTATGMTVAVHNDPLGATRVEVALEATDPPAAKKTAPAPGEPVRVKVVTVNKDEKGTTIVTEDGKTFRVVTPPAGEKKIEGADWAPKTDGKAPTVLRLWAAQAAGEKGPVETLRYLTTVTKEPDAAFLRRAVTEARGTPPTAIEGRYFVADADPKKREKLLDALLADPAAARRVGEAWKQRMLAAPPAPQALVVPLDLKGATTGRADLFVPYSTTQPKAGGDTLLFVQPKAKVEVVPLPAQPTPLYAPKLPTPPATPKLATLPAPPVPPTPPVATPRPSTRVLTAPATADRWQRLVAELIAAGKTDEQILEALTLAAAGRLPTEIEKRLTLATVPAAGDRAAAWSAVARALAGPPPAAPPAPPMVPKSPQ